MLRVAEHHAFTDTGRSAGTTRTPTTRATPLFAVADGMGGAQAGEVASHAAVEAVAAGLPEAGTARGAPRRASSGAPTRRSTACRARTTRRAGMGTTLTAVHVGESDIAIAHVGDSPRLPLPRRRARAASPTTTRSSRRCAAAGSSPPRRPTSTRSARSSPARSDPSPTSTSTPAPAAARDGDVFLLCSDGLTSMISETPGRGRSCARRRRWSRRAARSSPPPTRPAGATTSPSSCSASRRSAAAAARRAPRPADRGARPAHARTAGARRPRSRPRPAVAVAGAPRAAAGACRAARARTTSGRSAAAAAAARSSRSRGSPDRARPRRDRRVPGLAGRLLHRHRRRTGSSTIYRGLPYDLPAGIDLYSTNYISGVPATQVPAARRATLLDHQLRSHDDAADLVRQLEQGSLTAR